MAPGGRRRDPTGLFQTAPPASVPPGTGGLRVLLTSGKQTVVEYTVPSDGELRLLCNLPGHIERGMIGQVELRTSIGAGGGLVPSASPVGANAG